MKNTTKYCERGGALLLALSFSLQPLAFSLFADPPATTRYQVFTTGTNNLDGAYILSGTGALLGGTNGAVFNLGGFTFIGQLPGAAVSGTVPAAAVSGSAEQSGTAGYAATSGSAAQSGTNGFVLNTATFSGTLTITSSNTVLLDGTALGGGGISWPLVSTDGHLSIGSTAGTDGYIDDSGNLFCVGTGSLVNGQVQFGVTSGGNFRQYLITDGGVGTSSVQMLNNSGKSLIFGIFDAYDDVYIQGYNPATSTLYDINFQGKNINLISTGGAITTNYNTLDDGGGGAEFNGPVQMIDDTSRPSNSVTPAGYYHTKISGVDAWVPYYE